MNINVHSRIWEQRDDYNRACFLHGPALQLDIYCYFRAKYKSNIIASISRTNINFSEKSSRINTKITSFICWRDFKTDSH